LIHTRACGVRACLYEWEIRKISAIFRFYINSFQE
jgi:hypothetical protein